MALQPHGRVRQESPSLLLWHRRGNHSTHSKGTLLRNASGGIQHPSTCGLKQIIAASETAARDLGLFRKQTSLPVQELRTLSNQTRRSSSAAATQRRTAASQSFTETQDVHTVIQHFCLAIPKSTQLKNVQISASRKAWPYSSLQDSSTPLPSEQQGHGKVGRTTPCHTKEVT